MSGLWESKLLHRSSEGGNVSVPDQLDLIMEDGCVYHVHSFFAEKNQMGDVLDALTIEKIDRAM